MTQRVGIWALGLVTSAVVHIGAGAGLMAALQPEPVADQPTPESRLNVEAQEVTRSEAAEKATKSERAEAGETSGAALGAGAVAQSRAEAQQVPQVKAAAKEANALAEVTQPRAPDLATTPQQQPLATQALPSNLVAEPTVAADLVAQKPVAAAPKAQPLQVAKAQPARLPTTTPAPAKAAAAQVTPTAAPSQQPVTLAAATLQTPSLATPEQQPEVTASKAVLAFPTAGNIDPVSLAAFQSFTQPEAAASTDLRDSLSAALSVPCARMQVTFDPETTSLQLTGHVPTDSQRAPVLAALQAEMGADIEVRDNLLVLPAPQCGALSGIADVGLPQSTDQITNPLIVGNDTHARAFRYVAGQALVMNLTGPDYPAFVYVDYFDADGNVIHLSPNERAPLQRVEAKAALQIGARNAQDAGLFVTIGPPYGQEIAVAFASSVPLYDGLRPLVEPADAYLSWVKTRVAEARATHADFKGEWVYFFVTTAAQ